jgi:4'-phosphopantetheinyl transferase EntD
MFSLTALQTDGHGSTRTHSVILTYADLQQHAKRAQTTQSYLQCHCPLLFGRTQAHYRNELCAGQQSAPIYSLRSGHRRGTPCVTPGAGNPGWPKGRRRVGQPPS